MRRKGHGMNCIKQDNGKTTEKKESQEELSRHVEHDSETTAVSAFRLLRFQNCCAWRRNTDDTTFPHSWLLMCAPVACDKNLYVTTALCLLRQNNYDNDTCLHETYRIVAGVRTLTQKQPRPTALTRTHARTHAVGGNAARLLITLVFVPSVSGLIIIHARL